MKQRHIHWEELTQKIGKYYEQQNKTMEDKLKVFLDDVIEELSLEELNTLSQIIQVLTERKLKALVTEYNLNKPYNKN